MSQKGWSKEAICGLLGNIEIESHFNPGAWEVGVKNPGYGLVQWTPYNGNRKFLDWAELSNDAANKMAQDQPKKLMDLQLEYLIYSSVSTTPGNKREWFATTNYGSPYKMTYEQYIVSTKDAGQLALVFQASYERSADNAEKRQKRIDSAKQWYNHFSK